MVDGFTKSPRYVLRDGAHPTGPLISQSSSDVRTTAIFGFSDKPEYDVFWNASPLALKPYPLVKGYLQNQIAEVDDWLKLIVLDAITAQQPILHAATLQAVLESMQLDAEFVTVSHRLILDDSSPAYRVQIFADATPSRHES